MPSAPNQRTVESPACTRRDAHHSQAPSRAVRSNAREQDRLDDVNGRRRRCARDDDARASAADNQEH
jgi:hypothetical protein